LKIALFLGAGASVPFGKPTTKIFKEILLEKYNGDTSIEYLRDFLQNENFKDIEHVLQSIKEIQDFLQGYGGKFFSGSYNPLQIRFNNRMEKFDSDFFKKQMLQVKKTIEDEIFNHYRWDDKHNENLEKIFNKLFSLFEPKDGVHVFTTNYDNAIETYCDITQKHKPIDGFKHNVRGRNYIWDNFFSPPDHDAGIDVFLHKLHGSLDWKQLQNNKIVKTSEESKPSDPRYKHNMIIYPTLAPKDEEGQEPYKTIIHRFEEFMDDADICIVIGYSFRDHLNHSFLNFLDKGNTKLIIISPTAISDLHENLLREEVSKEKQVNWKGSNTFVKNRANLAGNVSRIYCIQQPLDVENIDKLMAELKKRFDDDFVKTI
jgi:hypothetical protein